MARGAYDVPPSSAAALAEWRGEASSVAFFVGDAAAPARDASERTKARHLYAHYKSWCEHNGHRLAPTSTAFGRALRDMGISAQKRRGHALPARPPEREGVRCRCARCPDDGRTAISRVANDAPHEDCSGCLVSGHQGRVQHKRSADQTRAWRATFRSVPSPVSANRINAASILPAVSEWMFRRSASACEDHARFQGFTRGRGALAVAARPHRAARTGQRGQRP